MGSILSIAVLINTGAFLLGGVIGVAYLKIEPKVKRAIHNWQDKKKTIKTAEEEVHQE